MGSKCAKDTFTDQSVQPGPCNCFATGSIQNVNVVRYVTADWNWSIGHGTALEQMLCNYDAQAPKEITNLIQSHAFDKSQPHRIVLPVIRSEKRCPKPNQLLRKPLCAQWYSSSRLRKESLVMALHVPDAAHSEQIFECVSNDTLPSLQLRSVSSLSKYDQITRTLLLDEQSIRVQAIAIPKEDTLHKSLSNVSPVIHMIVVNESDAIFTANETCKKLSTSTQPCIVVKVATNKACRSNSKAIDALAKYLNIPCVTISYNKPKTIADLFCFAVKYYWFCSVDHDGVKQ
eukprot:130643_1